MADQINWKTLGQFLSKVVDGFRIVRQTASKNETSLEIVDWLTDKQQGAKNLVFATELLCKQYEHRNCKFIDWKKVKTLPSPMIQFFAASVNDEFCFKWLCYDMPNFFSETNQPGIPWSVLEQYAFEHSHKTGIDNASKYLFESGALEKHGVPHIRIALKNGFLEKAMKWGRPFAQGAWSRATPSESALILMRGYGQAVVFREAAYYIAEIHTTGFEENETATLVPAAAVSREL